MYGSWLHTLHTCNEDVFQNVLILFVCFVWKGRRCAQIYFWRCWPLPLCVELTKFCQHWISTTILLVYNWISDSLNKCNPYGHTCVLKSPFNHWYTFVHIEIDWKIRTYNTCSQTLTKIETGCWIVFSLEVPSWWKLLIVESLSSTNTNQILESMHATSFLLAMYYHPSSQQHSC